LLESVIHAFRPISLKRSRSGDIAGQDIVSHGDDPAKAIQAVRDWLAASLPSEARRLAGSGAIIARYNTFLEDLPKSCDLVERDPNNLTFTDHAEMVSHRGPFHRGRRVQSTHPAGFVTIVQWTEPAQSDFPGIVEWFQPG
jgi:hypothetical protein